MLIRLDIKDNETLLSYSKVEVTENVLESENFTFFFDINMVDKTKVLAHFNQLNKIPSYQEIDELLKGNFFLAIYAKEDKKLTVYRDKSGIKSGYFYEGDTSLILGTNVHDVTKEAGVKKFNQKAILKYVYGDFLFNGETFYEQVQEVKRGGCYKFSENLKLSSSEVFDIDLADEENRLSEQENIDQLRQEIDDAHKDYLCDRNNILLSGGIDSVAMLIALDDLTSKDKINAISYKVKGTVEDETYYAKSIADHLNIPIEIKEIDPTNELNYASFKDKILKMNNPYVGMWIFGNFKGTTSEMFYAGQDTRLHTPSVNPIDKIAFNLIGKNNSVFVKLFNGMASFFRLFILPFNYKSNKYLKELYKLSHVFDVKTYVEKYYFKLDEEAFKKLGFSMEAFQELQTYFQLDYDAIKSPRELYNKIVSLKWSEQYINDIRYLQDIAKLNGTYIAMPFYLEKIAKFSAEIPFQLSIRSMMGRGRFSDKKRLVKKYMLRQSLKDKMNDTTYYRAKAVSSTLYLVFNGVLGQLIREELEKDLNRESSFLKEFKLEGFVERFLTNKKWVVSDEGYLLKVYQIGTLAIYNRTVLIE